MKFTILGCDGTYPDAHGATSGYLVTSGEDRLLLDAGSGVLAGLMALCKPEDLRAIILTHWHNDHACDMLPLKYYLMINKKTQRVLNPREKHPLKDLVKGNEFRFEDFGAPLTIGGFELSFLPVEHPVPAYAIKIRLDGRTLVYTGDVVGGEGLAQFCHKADLLVCDASFTTAQWHEGLPHFSAAQAGQLAKEAKVKQLMITHAQPGSDKALLLLEARQEFEHSIQAQKGMTLSL